MRQPTPISELYSWHRSAMEGRLQAVHEDEPKCGWFKVRMVKGGPFVPASITIEREIDFETGELADDERFVCEVDGEPRDAFKEWTWLAGRPISRADYDALSEMRAGVADMAATHVAFDLRANIIRPSTGV